MLDLKFILQNRARVEAALAQRGGRIDIGPLAALDDRRRALQQEFDALRAKQNAASQEIAKLKAAKKDAGAVLSAMPEIAARLKAIGPESAQVEASLNQLLLEIPNLPHASVPVGADARQNRVERMVGKPPHFSFTPKAHDEIGTALDILDFERGAKIAGARFTLYKGAGAALERALINFMLDLHTREHGYTEVLPPFMVNAASMTGTGQLPKFESDLFKVTAGYYLIPTAEVPVTNIFADEILAAKTLPICFTAYTPCFRSEAGAAGKDTRGLIRQHQFNKVELVKFTHPDSSYTELEKLTHDAEVVLQRLELPYRVVTLCTGDIGFGAAKTYDIEVWLPGQKDDAGKSGVYREISSCSNYEEFQARRAKIRFKDSASKNRFVHTLNGSGLAVGRTLIAILENFQQADGSVTIPKALHPYLHGLERLG